MFTFGKRHQVWRKGKPLPSVKVYTIQEDTKLVANILMERKFSVGRIKANFY